MTCKLCKSLTDCFGNKYQIPEQSLAHNLNPEKIRLLLINKDTNWEILYKQILVSRMLQNDLRVITKQNIESKYLKLMNYKPSNILQINCKISEVPVWLGDLLYSAFNVNKLYTLVRCEVDLDSQYEIQLFLEMTSQYQHSCREFALKFFGENTKALSLLEEYFLVNKIKYTICKH